MFLWLSFARAVANGNRAWRYGPKNGDDVQGGSIALAVVETLLRRDRTFFVRPHDTVLALDGDTLPQAAALRAVAAALRAAGYWPVLLTSGRNGGRHLWCRLPNAVLREAWDTYAVHLAGAKLVVRREGLRPPFVPHRERLPQALEEPTSVPEAWQALVTMPTHETLPPELAKPQPQPLAAKILRRLRTGDASGLKDGSGSGVVQAILVNAIRSGWTTGDAWNALMDPANAGGEALRKRVETRGEDGGRTWFELSWHAAETFVRNHPQALNEGLKNRQAIAAFVARVMDAEAAGTWKGRGGAARWRVALALATIAWRAATHRPDASVRRLAELTGLGISTCSRALRWLIAHGWIRRLADVARPGHRKPRDRAAAWGLVTATGTHTKAGACVIACVPVAVIARPEAVGALADAFAWGGRQRRGLGPACLRVLWRLASERVACTVETLAVALGMTHRRVRDYLARLECDGLVVREGVSWRAATDALEPARLEPVAQAHRMAGRHAQRVQRHREERENLAVLRQEQATLVPQVRAAAAAAGWPTVTLRQPMRLAVRELRLTGEAAWSRFLGWATPRWLREAQRALAPSGETRVKLTPMPATGMAPLEASRRAAACWVSRKGHHGSAAGKGRVGRDGRHGRRAGAVAGRGAADAGDDAPGRG